jgi:hypothetical protein
MTEVERSRTFWPALAQPMRDTGVMHWHRSIALSRIAMGARRNWFSFLARGRPPPPSRTQRFCEACGEDSPNDSFDDTGYGWNAQMWRCRHCGRETIKVWPVGF